MNTATAPPKPDCHQAAPTISTERNWKIMAGTGFTSGSDGAMPQIAKTDDVLGGDPRIEDHRIGVYQVYQRYVEGDETPEAIATSYDISVAEIHAALAYALNNPDEMREIEARNQARYEETAANRVVPDDNA
jgi:uncharacterized protein (DUF433 family)